MSQTAQNETQLKRSFGLKMGIILVLSSVIGSGVFKKIAPMSASLQSPTWVLIAWILAGLIILFGVWCVAELGSLFPDSGGPFSWLEKIYGKTVAFLYGWASFTVIQTAAIASVAYVFAGALDSFIHLPHLSPELEAISFLGIQPLSNIGAKIVTCILIIGLTIVNVRGSKHGGMVSMIFTFSIVLCLCLIVIAALTSGVGSFETFAHTGNAYTEISSSTWGFLSIFIIAMRSAFWGYEGWIALGFIGEEIQNPQRNLPRALTFGVLIIIGFYALVNFAYLYVLPVEEIAAGMSDPNYIGAVAVIDKIFGNNGVYIISGMILISTFGCTNATTLLSARIYYAMGQKGLFFKGAEKIHTNNKTPHKALIYQCIWACILTVSGSFSILTDLVIIAAFIFYGLIVFGVIIMRSKHKDAKRTFKTPLYPVVPIVFILFCFILLSISFVESPWKSLVGILLILSGLPFYYVWSKRNTVKE